jgi:hypothetical protein
MSGPAKTCSKNFLSNKYLAGCSAEENVDIRVKLLLNVANLIEICNYSTIFNKMQHYKI